MRQWGGRQKAYGKGNAGRKIERKSFVKENLIAIFEYTQTHTQSETTTTTKKRKTHNKNNTNTKTHVHKPPSEMQFWMGCVSRWNVSN